MRKQESVPLAMRLAAALRAARLGFSGRGAVGSGGASPVGPVGAGGTWGLLPGSSFDYERAAGDPRLNAVAAICLGWIGDNFPEAEAVVERRAEPGWEPVAEHPLLSLLARPNPDYDGDALWAATAMSYAAFGNCFWHKARSVSGRVVELWHVPNEQIRPVWPADGSRFLSGYEHRVDGRTRLLRREDVIHFRFGFDPLSQREGWYRLRAVLREVCTDNEAASMMAALLRNMGIPGMMVAPADRDTEIRPEDAQELQQQFLARFGGENRGKPLVGSTAWKVDRLGLTPEELTLDKARQHPEARICAALRLSPMVVGLNVGNEQRTFANYAEARRAAYEDCLTPMARRFARTLTRELLPELSERWEEERLSWDWSRVLALQPDLLTLYRQNEIAVRDGWMTPEEARARVGLL
jgi:HK97 family phage portal protein